MRYYDFSIGDSLRTIRRNVVALSQLARRDTPEQQHLIPSSHLGIITSVCCTFDLYLYDYIDFLISLFVTHGKYVQISEPYKSGFIPAKVHNTRIKYSLLNVVVLFQTYKLHILQQLFTVMKHYYLLWGRQLFEVLHQKSEGRGFDHRWCHWNF